MFSKFSFLVGTDTEITMQTHQLCSCFKENGGTVNAVAALNAVKHYTPNLHNSNVVPVRECLCFTQI